VSLLDSARNEHSQHGEDGIVAAVFDEIGTESAVCCEFGAWDGIHLSNTRALIERGWSGVMIESDAERFRSLRDNYAANESVVCLHHTVGTGKDSLGSLLAASGVTTALDFLSIDIDGRDYDVFAELDVRPRLVCVEVGFSHSPDATALVPREVADRDLGQPLPLFCEAARGMGYRLICCTLNAFFLRDDVVASFPTLTPREAYVAFRDRMEPRTKLFLYQVNKGNNAAGVRLGNRYASAGSLGIRSLVVRSRWEALRRQGLRGRIRQLGSRALRRSR